MVGDVHGCADEFARLLALARPSRVVCVGDLFTKGPDPEGVWDLIRDTSADAVLGNHEHRLLQVLDESRDDRRAAQCVERLTAHDPAWEAWVRELPLLREEAGWTVVHAALHPSGDLAQTTPYTATRLRRWPDDAPDDRRWWEVYEGERRVVFGHDARRGFVFRQRDGRPYVVGLDTGCVYGGALTGWLIEEERSVAVPAARAYKPLRPAPASRDASTS